MLISSKKTLEPTKKQITFARKLGIKNPENFSRKELALLIEQALIEKKQKEESVDVSTEDIEKIVDVAVEENPEEEYFVIEEYPGYTNIQNPIEIEISISENKNTFRLMKKKKTYQRDTFTLLDEFLSFLKRAKAKREEDKIIIKTGDGDSIMSPGYVRSVLDGFFVSYNWRYI